MKLILYSLEDAAGANIAAAIIARHGYEPNGEMLEGSPIYGKGDILLAGSRTNVKDLTSLPLSPEVCIVASRHKSESGKPTLTCHPTGNYGSADLGGSPGRLQLTDARILRACLMGLRKAKEMHGLQHEVSLEVTHHGPTELPFPLLYVEVGSEETQWANKPACEAVADVIHEALTGSLEEKPAAIGFGGPHYAPNFNGVCEGLALGHIMPKHAADRLDERMVNEMMEKTKPTPKTAVVDWKGLRGADKKTLQEILERLGMEMVKTSEMK